MNNIFLIVFIFLICFIITYFYIYWYVIFLLAIINSNAKYDEQSKNSILRLAQKEKIWRDVAKILNLK